MNDRWKYYQEWNRALFLHWRVDVADLSPLVPPALEIDTYEGTPWISLVAFTMERIRPRYLPPFPPVSNFDEINIRTYVKYEGKPGVYFLSIEGGKRLSCWIAKTVSELPYRYSNIQRTATTYTSKNDVFGDRFRAEFRTGAPRSQPSERDHWLTERYALFQDAGERIKTFDIYHEPWELRDIEINGLELNYPRFNELMEGAPEVSAYSGGVRVWAW